MARENCLNLMRLIDLIALNMDQQLHISWFIVPSFQSWFRRFASHSTTITPIYHICYQCNNVVNMCALYFDWQNILKRNALRLYGRHSHQLHFFVLSMTQLFNKVLVLLLSLQSINSRYTALRLPFTIHRSLFTVHPSLYESIVIPTRSEESHPPFYNYRQDLSLRFKMTLVLLFAMRCA